MNIINQSVTEITPKSWDLVSIKKFVEECGRTCYKSEDKITEDSHERFYNMIRNSGHTSVLEHGTVYCKIPAEKYYEIVDDHNFAWFDCPFKMENSVSIGAERYIYLSTSLQAILSHYLEGLLDYICEPEFEKDDLGHWIKHFPRRSFRIVTNIGVSRELNRHELILSVSEQSTRYCNYNKDKFNNEIKFIKPYWADIPTGKYSWWDGDWCDVSGMTVLKHDNNDHVDSFLHNLENTELYYKVLINSGCKPQEARDLLPLCTATEVVYTAWEDHYDGWDWKHILKLRSPKYGATGVHPQCAEIADMIYDKIMS